MTRNTTALPPRAARPLSNRSPATAFALVALLGASCGTPALPPVDRTVSCTLRWTGPADLDLTVDGVSAARLGGSPDVTQGGGSESINIGENDARETVVIGAANRSAEPGGSGDTSARATLVLVRHDGSTVAIDHAMDTNPWAAAIVHPKTGIVIPVP